MGASPELRRTIRIIGHLLSLSCACVIALCALSFYQVADLNKVAPSEMHQELSVDPIQTQTRTPTFNFAYGGHTYVIEPVADYEINGLVVSHNNVGGITDAYHSKNSVDLKDLCVVWGENAQSGIYKKLTFWSEPWTCFYRTDDRNVLDDFIPNQLSNNHIIGGTDAVREAVRGMHIGDQISLKGFLVNYWDAAFPDGVRRTSLTREDTGNGACEVLFTTDAKVLKASSPGWWRIYNASWNLALVLLAVKFLSFLILPYIEYRYT